MRYECEEKRAVYLTSQLVTDCDGVSKKVFAQKDALAKLGFDTYIVYPIQMINRTLTYEMNHHFFFDVHVGFMKSNYVHFYHKLYDFIKTNHITLLYIRYGINASPALIDFLSKCKKIGCVVLLEIPTYPYDGENRSFKEKVRAFKEHVYRNKLSDCVDRIITYSTLKTIFGTQTINISNAVAYIPPIVSKQGINNRLNCIGVANLAFWHGFDRLIKGLFLYYQTCPLFKVYFTIVGVGNQVVFQSLKELVTLYKLEEYVAFEGAKDGTELDDLFSKSQLAIGCLGCHRKGVKAVKALKNVEYAMRGLPFIYSEDNEDFDNQDYVLKVPADESPIDINQLCEFVRNNDFVPSEISKTVSNFTWENQMRTIVKAVGLI